MANTVYNSTQGFDVPLEHIPTDEDLQRLSDGEEGIVDQIILGLMGYVTGIVRGYVSKRPAAKPFQEDLVSEGLLTLTEFVNSKFGKAKIETSSFVPQVTGAIKNNSHDWLRENETTITINARTQQRGVIPPKRHEIKEGHATTGSDDVFNGVWVEEFTDELTDEQLEIVRMRMDGDSVHKISVKLNMHRARVTRIISQIEDLYTGDDE